MIVSNLQTCPVCGGEASIGKYNTYISSFKRADKYYGRCDKDFRHSQQDNPPGFLTKEEAIVAWNRRVNDDYMKDGDQ
jgi:hypothetical protein